LVSDAKQPERINVRDGVSEGVCVGIDPAREPDGIGLGIPPTCRVKVSIPVVVQAAFGVDILAWEGDVESAASVGEYLAGEGEMPCAGFSGQDST
jgi:hypothetical protein